MRLLLNESYTYWVEISRVYFTFYDELTFTSIVPTVTSMQGRHNITIYGQNLNPNQMVKRIYIVYSQIHQVI